MILTLEKNELLEYIRKQTGNFFPDSHDFSGGDVRRAFEFALDRYEKCASAIIHPGYHDEKGNVLFSHLHGDQYAQFIYFFANSLWHESQNSPLCSKLLLLNRTLFTFFLSYKCDMPDYFFLGHPFGTILGNAFYNDFLVVCQGVTVNTNQAEDGSPAPRFGKGVFLGTNATIVGNQPIGDRVSFGVNSKVYNMAVPSDSVVINDGTTDHLIRPRNRNVCRAQDYFSIAF